MKSAEKRKSPASADQQRVSRAEAHTESPERRVERYVEEFSRQFEAEYRERIRKRRASELTDNA